MLAHDNPPITGVSMGDPGLGNQSPSVSYTGVRTEKSSLLHKVGGCKPEAFAAMPAAAGSHPIPIPMGEAHLDDKRIELRHGRRKPEGKRKPDAFSHLLKSLS